MVWGVDLTLFFKLFLYFYIIYILCIYFICIFERSTGQKHSSQQKTNKMRNLAILPELLSDTNTFKFRKTVEAEMINYPQMNFLIDVIYKGQRIAILNGLSSPLQWTAKNGSNIPVIIIEKLEKMVVRLITKTYKIKNNK